MRLISKWGGATALIAFFGTLAFQSPLMAAPRPVDCEITVGGKTYVKKICQFSPRGGGSFQIDADEYFAQVSVNGDGTAELHWNEIPNATHAQAYLGTAKREGACWISPKARICARALPPAKTQALIAAAPAGGNLQLVVAGYPCLAVEGHKLGTGIPVALQNCRFPADNIWLKAEDGSLSLSKRPDLCLMAEAPGMMKPLQMIVDTCRPGLPRWRFDNGPDGGVIRSSDGDCLTIPKQDDPSSEFPMKAGAASCAKLGSRTPKFYFEVPK